jgi:hypothetical protein
VQFERPVVNVKLIATQVDPSEWARKEAEVKDLPPEKVLRSVLPDGFRLTETARLRGHFLLSALRTTPSGGSLWGVWLLDSRWRPVWSLRGAPGEVVYTRPDPSRTVLAIAELSQDARGANSLRVSVMRLPHHEPRAVLAARMSGWPWMGWAGKEVAVMLERAKAAYVVAVDPSTGTTRQVYAEQRSRTSLCPIESSDCWVSPDGAYLAFSRMPGGECDDARSRGIWLLELRTGRCTRVTREDTRSFAHIMCQWETAKRLKFFRQVAGGTWDLYEAEIGGTR